ncbi:hypothetical protein PPTG_10643 [Phytophthora nicotianae INRA-310]|uniref:Uncharacterized protein n=1 Tax=Phytophthora nicotianae (strain INRA-310) TaxID=761204 RepID=W2QDB6_PHYN3|nr:hypothetical protein PPTG_10643 [Phytophthora nicotianae INRA-310]ETN10519.1 hypothetical protein PPTG_10643 [Phytophthora nicotianae INRA-310]
MVHSVVQACAVAATLSGMALVLPTTDAHQIVLLPEPQWTTNDKDTKYNPLAFLENQGFKPQEDFAAWSKENGYKSLRDFMDRAKYEVTPGADFSCGFTNPKGTPQPIPAQGIMRSTGYTHDGPCEVYLDDTLVLQGDNCHEKFPGKDCPIDYSSCKGTCTLRWYWLGIRFLKNAYSWQVYKECIPLVGSGGVSQTAPVTSGTGKPETQAMISSPESPATQPPIIWGTPAMKTSSWSGKPPMLGDHRRLLK